MMLEGKVAVVTGVGPGMGREISLALGREGADVVLVARSDREVPEVASVVEGLGRRAVQVRADVSTPEGCARIAQATGDAFGRLDILVNSAYEGGDFTAFEDADLGRWRTSMDVNLWGNLGVTQACLPLLKESGDGRIVMVNTMAIQRIEANYGAYITSKAALSAATKSLAVELGAHGIRVNAIHPGYIWGAPVKVYFEWQATDRGGGITWQDVYDEKAAATALGYLPDAAEIAGAVLFFASPLSRAVTGQSLAVNCGDWIPPVG